MTYKRVNHERKLKLPTFLFLFPLQIFNKLPMINNLIFNNLPMLTLCIYIMDSCQYMNGICDRIIEKIALYFIIIAIILAHSSQYWYTCDDTNSVSEVCVYCSLALLDGLFHYEQAIQQNRVVLRSLFLSRRSVEALQIWSSTFQNVRPYMAIIN